MTTNPMRSLSGGEVSESLKARSDIPQRAAGLREQLNWITTRTGAATVRAGFEFGGLTKSQDSRVRQVPFIFNQTDALVLEFGDYYVRFWKGNALVTTGTSISAWSNASVDYVPGDYVTGTDG
ncbi:MAG: hypothetical protein KDA28_07085, partial [Phycisphaerales bacterium]|nr:hypothetical protein [Phycisphaerales bacterium]